MSVQNPTIPTATQAKGIDAVILDLQTHLDFELSWLTNGMGRAYRLTKVRANQTTVFLPEVYLGVANRWDYFAATPDNDKQGQSIFFVGDATLPDQQKGFYGWVEHEVGIIFSANLETIDSTLLETEDFTEHLIQDVREALIRDLVGKSYRLNIDSITREFDDVYAEFDVARDRGVAHAPMTHFRINATVTFKEDCAGVSLDRCTAILQNLSSDDLCNCVIPTIDFNTSFSCLTPSQVTDLEAIFGVGYQNTHSLDFNGIDDYVVLPDDAALNFERTDPFTITAWIKVSSYASSIIIARYLATGNFTGWVLSTTATGGLSFGLNRSLANRIGVNTNTAFNLNEWVHVAVTYDGSSNANGVTLYYNGVSRPVTVTKNTLTLSTLITAEPRIGITQLDSLAFDGKMTEVRMWNVEQNAAFILDDYNSGSPKAAADTANTLLLCRFGVGALWQSISNTWRFRDDSNLALESPETAATLKTIRTTDVP